MKDVIVTGGRDHEDWQMVQDVLELFDIGLLIQGGAKGADRLGRAYAKLMNIECVTVEAAWKVFGPKAGPLRNREMLDKYPNAVVIAFPGGRGTADCVRQAVAKNMVVLRVER